MAQNQSPAQHVAANKAWWDAEADQYQQEFADQLGHTRFVWGPEGLTEDQARLLGDVTGRTVLEVGAGAAQCSRWLATQGAQAIALDISMSQLRHAQSLDAAAGCTTPALQAHAGAIPLATHSVDIAFASYGALQFVADPETIFAEVARVLRPAGRWVFSVTHPVRWAFPDDPTAAGLTATRNYFDTTPYTEHNDAGDLIYSEHHHTLGDWIRYLTQANLRLLDLVEPEWTNPNQPTWGGWSMLRGQHIPGTAIFVTASAPA